MEARLHFEARAPCAIGDGQERCLGSKPGNLCPLQRMKSSKSAGGVFFLWWFFFFFKKKHGERA